MFIYMYTIYTHVCIYLYVYIYMYIHIKCVCMHACMYACMYACMHVCMQVCKYASMHVLYSCMHVWMYGCMDVWMYGCMYVCMHACMYVCVSVCVCLNRSLIYTHACGMCGRFGRQVWTGIGVCANSRFACMGPKRGLSSLSGSSAYYAGSTRGAILDFGHIALLPYAAMVCRPWCLI